MKTWWYEVTGEESDLCGEEFFVEARSPKEADEIARDNFPGEELHCLGRVSDYEAECMGLDTY